MLTDNKTVTEEIVYLIMLLRKARIAIEVLSAYDDTEGPVLNGLLAEIKKATEF